MPSFLKRLRQIITKKKIIMHSNDAFQEPYKKKIMESQSTYIMYLRKVFKNTSIKILETQTKRWIAERSRREKLLHQKVNNKKERNVQFKTKCDLSEHFWIFRILFVKWFYLSPTYSLKPTV